jgi:hypothetical protein
MPLKNAVGDYYTKIGFIDEDRNCKYLQAELAASIRIGAGGLTLEECLYRCAEFLPISIESYHEAKELYKRYRLLAKAYATQCLIEHNPAEYLEMMKGTVITTGIDLPLIKKSHLRSI